MIPDYLITAIIGALSAIIVNIIYYEYQFRKEKKLEFLKMQITELLLPLYVHFKNIESETNAYCPVKAKLSDEIEKILSTHLGYFC